MGSCCLCLTWVIDVSWIESERVKTNDVTRSFVGDLRNVSWSFGDRIRLFSLEKVHDCSAASLGGHGSAGVGGAGFKGASSDALGRRRGVSFGSLALRSGTAVLPSCDDGDDIAVGIMLMIGVVYVYC